MTCPSCRSPEWWFLSILSDRFVFECAACGKRWMERDV